MKEFSGSAVLADFLSITAHHIRQPLRILNLREQESSLAGTMESESARDLLRQGAEQLKSLSLGIGQLSDAITPPRRLLSVPLAIPLRHAAEDLGSELKIEADDSTLPTVEGDFDRWTLVFRHLLDNSQRYGATKVEVHWAPEREILFVRDDGPGIEKAYREKVFEAYRRLHGDSIPGAGLGLTICQLTLAASGTEIRIGEQESGTCIEISRLDLSN